MSLLDSIPHHDLVPNHHPWPRALVSEDGWQAATGELVAGRATLLGFWGEPAAVHMALLAEANGIAVVSFACSDGWFPSVARVHPPALRLERTIHDLFGLEARGADDIRPWLDHGAWGGQAPLGRNKRSSAGKAEPYRFLPAEGEGLHRVAVGPVH